MTPSTSRTMGQFLDQLHRERCDGGQTPAKGIALAGLLAGFRGERLRVMARTSQETKLPSASKVSTGRP
jgi:hypothetical protein